MKKILLIGPSGAGKTVFLTVLAAKLTGWKIDIKPESGFFGEEEEA